MAPMLNDPPGEDQAAATQGTMDAQPQPQETGTKRSSEDSDGEEPPSKRLHENEPDEEQGDDTKTTQSNGLANTSQSDASEKRPRGRPRKDSDYVKPPKDDSPKKRGRPRIHPPKDPNAEKRPRGRPPTTAKAIAKKQIAEQIAEGAKNMSFEEMQKFTINSQKKMLDMKKKIKDLENMLEERDEQIFMLRSKLQEMGVDTDSLSMCGNSNQHLMYMGQEEMIPHHQPQERPIDVILVRPETDTSG